MTLPFLDDKPRPMNLDLPLFGSDFIIITQWGYQLQTATHSARHFSLCHLVCPVHRKDHYTMSDRKKLGFAENFALSGAAAVISKTAAAPIERVKLLVQNQDEMIKAGRLAEPYKGVIDCTLRTYRTEGLFLDQ